MRTLGPPSVQVYDFIIRQKLKLQTIKLGENAIDWHIMKREETSV